MENQRENGFTISTEPIAMITITNGELAGVTYIFGEEVDSITIGRTKGYASLSIPNDIVMSRRHCEISVEKMEEGYRFWLRDLSSMNGTVLNSQRVGNAVLRDGDLLQAGKTIFRFRIIKEPLALGTEDNEEEKLDSTSLISYRYVFISYAKEDLESATAISKKLEEAGIQTWMDQHNLLPGQDWDFEIKQAMNHAGVVLVILSNLSISKRGYVQREISLALDIYEEIPDKDVFLIPVMIEECNLPDRINKFHAAKLFLPDGYRKLIQSIKTKL